MFEHLQRQLRDLSKTKEITVPIEADADGFLDKECPSEKCLFQFKVLEEDYKNILRDDVIFCPSCRHAEKADAWFTTEQMKAAKEYAINHVTNKFNAAIRADDSGIQSPCQSKLIFQHNPES